MGLRPKLSGLVSVFGLRLYFSGRRLTYDYAMVIVLHSITVVCPRLLTVGDSVVLFAFLFCLILYGAPAMSLT